MRRYLPLVLASCLLLGCGGLGSTINDGSLDGDLEPLLSTVALTATKDYAITLFAGVTPTHITWRVQELNAGSVVPASGTTPLTATYTAPNRSGTFHVQALITANGQVQTLTATIVVA